MKTCRSCGQSKSRDHFYNYPRARDGLASYCKPCAGAKAKEWKTANRERAAEYGRRWREANPDRVSEYRQRWGGYKRAARLREKYGLTVEDYEALLGQQGGVCALCGGIEECGKLLAVDHCHETGRVRGLLCNRCNRGIGYFKDDPDALIRAASYLRLARA